MILSENRFPPRIKSGAGFSGSCKIHRCAHEFNVFRWPSGAPPASLQREGWIE
jgi:hypothetical protein